MSRSLWRVTGRKRSVDRRSRGIIGIVVTGKGHGRMEFKFVVHHTII